MLVYVILALLVILVVVQELRVRHYKKKSQTCDKTGLLNDAVFRKKLKSRIKRLFDEREQAPHSLCVLYFDLDGFKSVNDHKEGDHTLGDELIIAFADCLLANVRSDDLVARVGGDEFAVAMTDIHSRQVTMRIEQIRAAFQEIVSTHPGLVPEVVGKLGVSVGIRIVKDGNLTASNIIKEADKAMKADKAKRGGAR